ncbi:uncharacterized protein AAES06_001583 isoform 1-T1 [Glossophaga mutica]
MTRGQSLLISINRKCCVNNAAKISPIVNFQEEKGVRLSASGIPQSLRSECSLDHLEDASRYLELQEGEEIIILRNPPLQALRIIHTLSCLINSTKSLFGVFPPASQASNQGPT